MKQLVHVENNVCETYLYCIWPFSIIFTLFWQLRILIDLNLHWIALNRNSRPNSVSKRLYIVYNWTKGPIWPFFDHFDPSLTSKLEAPTLFDYLICPQMILNSILDTSLTQNICILFVFRLRRPIWHKFGFLWPKLTSNKTYEYCIYHY